MIGLESQNEARTNTGEDENSSASYLYFDPEIKEIDEWILTHNSKDLSLPDLKVQSIQRIMIDQDHESICVKSSGGTSPSKSDGERKKSFSILKNSTNAPQLDFVASPLLFQKTAHPGKKLVSNFVELEGKTDGDLNEHLVDLKADPINEADDFDQRFDIREFSKTNAITLDDLQMTIQSGSLGSLVNSQEIVGVTVFDEKLDLLQGQKKRKNLVKIEVDSHLINEHDRN